MSASAVQTVPSCPDGHGAMVLRHSRTGDFYSCGTYPACRRSAPVPLDLACPRCRAPLVVRASKKSGKRFTGCSSWPACSYVAWTEPHACTSCGRPCLGAEGEREAVTANPAVGGGHDDVPF